MVYIKFCIFIGNNNPLMYPECLDSVLAQVCVVSTSGTIEYSPHLLLGYTITIIASQRYHEAGRATKKEVMGHFCKRHLWELNQGSLVPEQSSVTTLIVSFFMLEI